MAAACGNAKHGGEAPGSSGRGGRAGQTTAGATATGGAGRAGAGGRAGGAGNNAGAAEGGSGGTSGSTGMGGRAGSLSAGSGGTVAMGEAGESGAAGAAGAGDLGALGSLIEAFCGAARACCGMGPAPTPLHVCEDAFVTQSDNVALVAAGKAQVDERALARCVAAYQAARSSCVQDQVVAACHGILLGTVPDDGACTNVLECDRSAGPKVCLIIQGSGSDSGTCKTPPRGMSGDPCAASCERGSDCSSTASSPDTSTPIALCYEADGLYCPIGESCAPIVSDGQDCRWDEPCGSQGFCVSTCTPTGGSGDPCDLTFGCGPGLACVSGACAPEPLAMSETCVGYPPSFD